MTWKEVSQRTVDPDRELKEELDRALAGMPEASGDMDVDPSGSALLDTSPPRDATIQDFVSTVQSKQARRKGQGHKAMA
jgi:hypothetical protein